MEAKSVDSILVDQINQAQKPPVVAPSPAPEVSAPPPPAPESAPALEADVPRGTESEPEPESKDQGPIDEYGNPIAPPKVYTEEEVNRMMRERFSRGKWAEQPQPAPQVAPQPQAQPGEENWEEQLNTYIDKRVETRERDRQERAWREDQAAKQADFEARFSSGMNKYQDFHQVVASQPISDSMLLATRTLENPAAFVYGAAKLYPQDLAKISHINDPIAQAAEIGRLHEKMVKNQTKLSAAPKPIETAKSDLPPKAVNPQLSIDQRINDYGRQKQQRR